MTFENSKRQIVFLAVILFVTAACNKKQEEVSPVTIVTPEPTPATVNTQSIGDETYECETGIDPINEVAMAKFEINKQSAFKQVILDSTNRVWIYCFMSSPPFREGLDCVIGQLPTGLPPGGDNYNNLVIANEKRIAVKITSLQLTTNSLSHLASASHIVYEPYINCLLKP